MFLRKYDMPWRRALEGYAALVWALAGAAVVATAAAPDRVVGILLFLAALRVLQDYVIYPRLISRALHLHPLAVVVAIWAGAGLGGLVGVCLAVPLVGMLQVTHRHWREYRDIELLVADAGVRRGAVAAGSDEGSKPPLDKVG
jgi:predicted PurR-regulated permease PerM